MVDANPALGHDLFQITIRYNMADIKKDRIQDLIASGLPETYSFISRDHIEHVALCIEVVFSLSRRDVSNGSK